MRPTKLDELVQVFYDEVERQRAIYGFPAHPKPSFQEWPEDEKACWRASLLAVIEALKTPTQGMVSAALDHKYSLVEQGHVYDEYDSDPATLAEDAPATIWAAMLDHIIADSSQ